jgi:hypothetical protein
MSLGWGVLVVLQLKVETLEEAAMVHGIDLNMLY